MDKSSEVANIHRRTDAKNLVTTERIIHLPEGQETIHIISTLRKEAYSESIHDLAHIPYSELFGKLFDETSAKEDNLITAVKKVRLLDVDMHPSFTTLMETARRVYVVSRQFFS